MDPGPGADEDGSTEEDDAGVEHRCGPLGARPPSVSGQQPEQEEGLGQHRGPGRQHRQCRQGARQRPHEHGEGAGAEPGPQDRDRREVEAEGQEGDEEDADEPERAPAEGEHVVPRGGGLGEGGVDRAAIPRCPDGTGGGPRGSPDRP